MIMQLLLIMIVMIKYYPYTMYSVVLFITLQYTNITYGRLPKFHSVFLGRDPGTLKSDIVSKKHPHLICSDLRVSNWEFEDWNYGNRPYYIVPPKVVKAEAALPPGYTVWSLDGAESISTNGNSKPSMNNSSNTSSRTKY